MIAYKTGIENLVNIGENVGNFLISVAFDGIPTHDGKLVRSDIRVMRGTHNDDFTITNVVSVALGYSGGHIPGTIENLFRAKNFLHQAETFEFITKTDVENGETISDNEEQAELIREIFKNYPEYLKFAWVA